MRNPKRVSHVGIYSGTFDPVHDGHIAFAEAAREHADLDKIFFLIEPRPRRKQGVKAFDHRVKMVQLAIKDHADFGVIILEQARFTVAETLPILQARFKNAELHMLMGEDVFAHLSSWPHLEEFVRDVNIIIGIREGSSETVLHQLKALKKIRHLHPKYEMFETELAKYSSSKVRLALRKGRIPEGLHPEVVRYIQKNQLYAPADEQD